MSGLIDIEMPGGVTLTDVPEGTSRADILKAYAKVAPAAQPDYKRETARQQFEANAPIPTMASQARGMVGAAGESLKNMVIGPLQHAKDNPNEYGTPEVLGGMLKGMYHGVVDPVANYYNNVKQQYQNPDLPEPQRHFQGVDSAVPAGQILTQSLPTAAAATTILKPIDAMVTEHVTGPAGNSALEIPKRMQAENIDPMRQLITDKFMGTKKEVPAFMAEKLKELGPQLEQRLTQGGQGREINGQAIVDAELGNAKRQLVTGSDPNFQNRLDQVEVGIKQYAKQNGLDLERLTPLQAQRFKSYLGQSVRWADTTGPVETGINDTLSGIYGGLQKNLAYTVDGIGNDMRKWGNYEVGSKAADASILADKYRIVSTLRGLAQAANPLTKMPVASVLGRVFRDPLPTIQDPPVIPESRRLNAGLPLPDGGQSMGEPINVTNGRPETGTRAERTGRLLPPGKVDAAGNPLYEMRGPTADQNLTSSVSVTTGDRLAGTGYPTGETVLDRARKLREADKKSPK
jgi:hypothetical protein